MHEPAVRAFVARCGRDRVDRERSPGSPPAVGTLRLGINVSLGARQAVRSVGTALGLDPVRVHSLARQVPLLSSPGAVEQVLTRSPEMGGTLSASSEPGPNDSARRRSDRRTPVSVRSAPIGVHRVLLRPRRVELAAGALGQRRPRRPRPLRRTAAYRPRRAAAVRRARRSTCPPGRGAAQSAVSVVAVARRMERRVADARATCRRQADRFWLAAWDKSDLEALGCPAPGYQRLRLDAYGSHKFCDRRRRRTRCRPRGA